MTTVLVLGGYGAVGRHLVARLRQDGHTALTAGRDAVRADRPVDLAQPDLRSYQSSLDGIDVVVNASGKEEPRLAELATARGAAFVDITATASYVAALERLDPPRPVLLSVGLAPGLTNLLAAAVHRASPGPIDVAVLLGAGERHGPAATDWTYRLLGGRFHHDGTVVRNFTRPRRFDLPGYGRRRLYRLDFSDQHTLTRDLNVRTRTYFGLDSRTATTALAALTWLPGGSRLPRGLHVPGGDDWLLLAQGHDGTTRWARGRNQSHGTAIIAAAAVGLVTGLPPGTHHLHDVLDLHDLPMGQGIELHTPPPSP
ncbi:NAD-dependent epimerase/dehydratase family protein [Actinomadura montaniterrae]|uniref:NAD-dependent epimerase/dehydratase family protein n=1 Tax=Actinomadura montaniterrae TaxID=1803903 RepID=A0A6L3VYB7_9ACTN|nr:NAD-dependent epimerase/dehydratase family protein [Actinomadura montaniterrae]KAB2386211.1 NAD-dependent epimerase/dehydratase family protein [Actinomadura montaniterrae]